MYSLIIRMNDLVKLASEFELFKKKCIKLFDERMSDRVD